MQSQHLLFHYVNRHKYWYLSAVLLTMTANVIQSYFPQVIGQFTDELQQERLTRQAIVDYSLWLLAIGLAFGLLAGIGQYVILRLGRRFEHYTRNQLFTHFTSLDEHYYSRHGVGKLLSFVMNDVKAVRESISMGINQTVNAGMLVLSSLVMMLISDIPLYLIAICMAPLLVIPFVVTRVGPVIRHRSHVVQEALGKMTESAEEQFGGIRVTKKFAVEPIMRERFGETVDRIRRDQLLLVKISSLFQAIIPFLGAISVIVALLLGGYLTIRGQLTLGQFVALTLYIRMMVGPLQQIGNVINTMQRSRASLERINSLLMQQGAIQELNSARPVSLQNCGLDIRRLSFAYPDTDDEALHQIDLEVKPGQTLGIIGKTGSGKTTLVKLLLRIYDPPPGTIRFGGTDIRELTLESLRNQIAYVPQDGFLFSTTIRDNIAFFHRDSELHKVEQAARQAQIYGSITSFPERFETKLGERGITLSGGQRQRTSLARGLIKDAPILILDDSVSAVDAVTETEIIRTIRRERRGKTTLIIAHRISALRHADQIVVLDKGKIVQRGTHEELVACPGIYRTLHSIQEEGSAHAEEA